MQLAMVSDIREKLGFDDMTDINFAISMAMDSVEPQLAATLNTEFDRGTFVDTFYVSAPRFRDGQAVETQFRLRRGLVQSVTSVLTCADVTAFGDSASVVDVSAVANLSADKGVIKDFKTHYARQYVQVTYVAGFDPDGCSGSPPTRYLLSQVPAWLQEATKLRTLLALADSPSLSEAAIKLDTEVLATQCNALLSRHIRYAPLSILPL
jgi:hypothetical protein